MAARVGLRCPHCGTRKTGESVAAARLRLDAHLDECQATTIEETHD